MIPGSDLSVYEDHEFLRKTEIWLKNLIDNYPNVKFLGICFGFQILVQALGGEMNSKDQRVFIRGAESIRISDDFWNIQFVKNSNVPKVDSLVILEAHGDHVVSLPDYDLYKFKSYGTSESCKIEMIVSENERIFALQGHPEYHPEFNICRVASLFCMMRKIEPTEENKEIVRNDYIKSLYSKHSSINSNEFRRICFSFLKN
jgi:GMP synthase-like glutamine amidotransferase